MLFPLIFHICHSQTTYRLCIKTTNDSSSGTAPSAIIKLQYAYPEYNSKLLECEITGGVNQNERKCCNANDVGFSREFSKIWFSISINDENYVVIDSIHLETINNGVTTENVFNNFKCYNTPCGNANANNSKVNFCSGGCGCKFRFYQRKWTSPYALCSKGSLW